MKCIVGADAGRGILGKAYPMIGCRMTLVKISPEFNGICFNFFCVFACVAVQGLGCTFAILTMLAPVYKYIGAFRAKLERALVE